MSADSTSSSSPSQCPSCGAPLPEQAPQGLCPKCLFAGLAAPTEDGMEAASRLPPPKPQELAPHFPQLEILECLGRGGMGVVYKARQKSLNRLVALKLLAPERVSDPAFAERFAHEAQSLAKLSHPNIVTIHDFGQAGGFFYLLMEFVDGVNLREAMKAGRFTPEEALAIVPPVCEALQYAHEHGIVHRDIKPENLLLDRNGRVKIADFGVAKMLGAEVHEAGAAKAVAHSMPAGTPQYMAPEQAKPGKVDHRADIYSLGVVLYELLTGELPAARLQPPSSRIRGMQIDVRLDEVVLRALEKTPELRYQTAGEFGTQVETVVNQRPRGTLPTDQPKRKGLKIMLWLVLIFGVGVIGVPLTWYLSFSKRGDGPRAQIHTRVFEADAKLVDELVPAPTRKPGQIQDSEEAIRIEPSKLGQTSRAAQTAEISADVFARLLEDGSNPPGMLDEQAREGYWWPKVPTSWHYMRRGKVAGGGNLEGFLSLRRHKGVLQLRVEFNGIHGMNSAYQVVRIVWEGGAPPPDAARVFFIPVSRTDGTPRYLVIAVEVGNGTENAGRISNVHAEKQKATAQSASFGPAMERVLPSGVPCREQLFQFRNGNVYVIGNGPGTSKEEAAYDEQKIDDAGGVDLSAGSGDTGISIVGRGCIFTQDVEELKWDSFTAEQVMHAMNRVSFVDGIVSPKKAELPITYLFKTARGEVGIMEVVGVVDGQPDGWNEKGMKFRYKLVQGTGTTTASAATKSSLVFGPETRGLQAAIDVTPSEPFKIRIHVRNASDHGISIDGASYRQDDECLLADAQGQSVPVTKVPHDIRIGMKGGYFGPGQVAVFVSAGLSFQDIDKVPASAGYVAKVRPGRYTLRFRLRLPGDDLPFAAGERAWKGELETGPVTIELKDPSTQPVEPVADSIWSSVLGPVVERTVNDLQITRENCALSFDSGKLLPVPANITLDILTNPSAQPAAVAWARDNQVDAVAFVTSDADKVVKCGLLCPGLVVLRANNKEWIWDSATPQDLKETFDEAMHKWKEIPQIAEVTSDDQFPANYMILDTRTHRRGVLQITGVADHPRGVKIRYRLVEGAAVKKPASLEKAP